MEGVPEIVVNGHSFFSFEWCLWELRFWKWLSRAVF